MFPLFRWHSTRLRVVSARTPAANAINFRSSLSICWRKLIFRTITSDISRSNEPSKLEPPSLSPKHDIYISTSIDPFFNLSLEDWLFRHSPPSSPLLLIYRDSPCVIIGRNQNPWTEVNFTALRAARIPFIRRRSGGGTVYHDLGNTNFSLHLPRASFNRHATSKLILRAVRSLGVDAHVNERNDICVGFNKISLFRDLAFTFLHCLLDKRRTISVFGQSADYFIMLRHKSVIISFTFLLHMLRISSCLSFFAHYLPFYSQHVSGSAYKIVSKRAYHHGTMLISTRLDHLGDMLRPEEKNIITKGVSSIRSPVCNLEQFDATITHEGFTSAVVQEFRKEYQIDTKCCMVEDLGGARDIEYIRKGMSELSTWDWRFGQTPEFTHTLRRIFSWGDITAEIRSKHGLILDCSLQLTNTRITSATFELLNHWARSFRDKRYGFLHETGKGTDTSGGLHLLRCERNQPILDVKAWLEDAIKCDFDGSS